ncbi:MAG: hypothetical protein MI725_01100 [Pirellulales bacterium]|nr:hypothetical protein [Pirellulales bacterium]
MSKLLLVFASSAIFFLIAPFATSQNVIDSYEQKRAAMLKSWHELFGDQIDFTKKAFFNNMSAAGAKALTEFKELEGVKRTQWLKRSSDRWLRTFFKAAYFPEIGPEKYYLQKANEPSVLFYHWQVGKLDLTMFESISAVLVEISLTNGDVLRPSQKEFSMLMDRVFNIELSEEEIVNSFDLNGRLVEGAIVTNAPNLDDGKHFYYDWRKGIITFGSKHGLCVLLLKAAPGRASPNLPQNPNWLKEGLVFGDQ